MFLKFSKLNNPAECLSGHSAGTKIFPNPSTNYIYLTGNARHEIIEYVIYGLDGDMALSGDYNDRINLTGLSKGLYYVKVRQANGRFIVGKFIRQ